MNEEDLLNLPDDEYEEALRKMEIESRVEEDSETATEAPNEPVEDVNIDSTEEDGMIEETAEETDEDAPDEGYTDAESQADDNTTDENDTEEEPDSEELDSNSDSETEVDYKAEYERVLAPFKANGKTIKVDSVDDAVALMQMGANYNKKMADIKPHLKVVKMLENNGIKEDRLNELIEVANGNKDAIKKVFAESGLDPYDLDLDSAKEYRPKDYSVNDSEIELDQVIADVQESEKFVEVAKFVNSDIDNTSKALITSNPHVLKVLTADMESGFFDEVQAAMTQAKALGKVPAGMSDLDLYGSMAQQLSQSKQMSQTRPEQAQSNNRKDIDRKAKKKAIAPTKKSPKKAKEPLVDVLSMSDEDFLKFEQNKYK